MGNDQKKLISSLSNSSTNQYHPDIIVVSEKSGSVGASDELGELSKLDYVPLIYPILKSSVDVKETTQLFEIRPSTIARMSEVLQDHLHTCAFNVTKDQESISIQIKHVHAQQTKVDFVVDVLIQNFVEKQKKHAKHCENFQIVGEMAQSLRKIQRSVENEIVPLINKINAMLPEEERLEPFSFD